MCVKDWQRIKKDCKNWSHTKSYYGKNIPESHDRLSPEIKQTTIKNLFQGGKRWRLALYLIYEDSSREKHETGRGL